MVILYIISGQKVPVKLEKVAGKLTTGIPASHITFKEEKKSKVVPGRKKVFKWVHVTLFRVRRVFGEFLGESV